MNAKMRAPSRTPASKHLETNRDSAGAARERSAPELRRLPLRDQQLDLGRSDSGHRRLLLDQHPVGLSYPQVLLGVADLQRELPAIEISVGREHTVLPNH